MRALHRLAAAAILATTGVAVLIGAATGPAAAQAGGERITSYDVDLRVEPTGTLLVRETIAYDFGDASRHGIIREIPVRFHHDGRSDRLEPVHVLSVGATPGTPKAYRVEHAGGVDRVRIGDPNQVVTGAHTYEIAYRVDGALNGFADHVELFWNAIGDEWSVPIERATVRVEAPRPVARVACYAGPLGSRLACGRAVVEGGAATFAQEGLDAGSGLTVVAALPLGAVPTPVPILRERWSLDRAFARTPATLGGSFALLVAVIGGFGALVWQRGRDRRWVGSPVDVAFGSPSGADEPVPLLERTEEPVEFEPPDKLRPGQLGTLVDGVANPLDVTATIVDLAVRGRLRIEEIPKEGWFAKPDWTLVALPGGQGALLGYEQVLLDALFESGNRPEVKLSELRNTFAAELAKVQEALYADTASNGWFRGRPDRVRLVWTGIGIAALAGAVGVLVLLARFTHAGLVALPLVIGAVLVLSGSHWMPSRTPKGTGVLRRALGFRRFIEESEKDRARFAERQNLFSEYLPYAVVFGATEKWARTFAGLDGRLPDTSGWYMGSQAFTLATFAGTLDGFATTTSGTISSTPGGSGASGFGGGGFSGGGGGGGGGGSW